MQSEELLKVGDKVLLDYENGNGGSNTKGLLTWLGVIIKDNNNNTYHVMYFNNHTFDIAYNVEYRYIIPIVEAKYERERVTKQFNNLIEEERKKLKTVLQVEKDKEKVERYESIKQRIIRNCENCIKSDLDDYDFVNRVKEIANLKKQLFSPEMKLPCIEEIRRYNGEIKSNIRKLEQEKNYILERISDEEIERRLKDF